MITDLKQLTHFDELDDVEACYSFDLLSVWSGDDGILYWGQDSGCSCPSPFEDFGVNDYQPLANEHDFEVFRKAVDNRGDMNTVDQKAEFINRVRQEMLRLKEEACSK